MKRYFIHTFGCQMNVNDSMRMGEVLGSLDYRPTPVAEEADLIILNTCSIREKAEDKMLSALGRYRTVKLARGTLLGVGGCVAQQEKDKLAKEKATSTTKAGTEDEDKGLDPMQVLGCKKIFVKFEGKRRLVWEKK